MEEMRYSVREMNPHRPDTVSLIGCGPSALECGAASAPGLVVAINGAFRHVRFDISFTMDGRFARYEWEALKDRACVWRYSAAQHAMRAGAQGKMERLELFGNNRETTEFSTFVDPATGEATYNGSNSGYCALNFAYALKPRAVYLYGYDMGEPEHFFGDYPWKDEAGANNANKFQLWRREMYDARRQFDAAGIKVFNTNPNSAIKAFQYGRPTHG